MDTTATTYGTGPSITREDIVRAMDEVTKYMPFHPRTPSPFLFNGLRIVEAPVRHEPRMKLRDDLPLPDEFRAEMNAWLLEFFGDTEVCIVPKGQVFLMNNIAVMRPEAVALLG